MDLEHTSAETSKATVNRDFLWHNLIYVVAAVAAFIINDDKRQKVTERA
jgi:hypothetical protein